MGKALSWLTLLIAGAILAWSTKARSEDWAELRWQHPTGLTGTWLPLFLTDIQGTDIEYGPCPLTAVAPRSLSLNGIQTRVAIGNLTPGPWCFRLYTRATQGRSQASATVQKLIPAAGCGNGCHE